MRHHLLLVCGLAFAITLAHVAVAADAPVVAATQSSPNYQLAIKQYMTGQFDELEETLRASDLLTLKGQERADIAYIRKCIIEVRPTWWKKVKGDNKTPVHFLVFGRSVDATFDPKGKGGVSMTMTTSKMDMNISWAAGEMDSKDQAEHGFTKGDLNSLNVFSTLGYAAAYPSIPQSYMQDPSDAKKLLMFRMLDFQGDLGGTYYGSPRARQWGLWLYMHSYLDKYAKMQMLNSRKAVALAFMIEVISNPEKYPSIKLPAKVEADKTEEKLALAIHQPIEKKGWTLAEDKSIRDALRTLASENPAPIMANGKIKLAAGLFIQLDPEQDSQMLAAREAWFKKQFENRK